MSDKRLHVQVVYAKPEWQHVLDIEVPVGATIRAAIERSHILRALPEIDLAVNRVGIYGELKELADTVNDGDRIEIYRPLLLDPKDARRLRAGTPTAK